MNKQESSYKLTQMERLWTDDTNKENLQEITTKCFEKKSLGIYPTKTTTLNVCKLLMAS